MKILDILIVLRNIWFTHSFLSLRKQTLNTQSEDSWSEILLMWSISSTSLGSRALPSVSLHLSSDYFNNCGNSVNFLLLAIIVKTKKSKLLTVIIIESLKKKNSKDGVSLDPYIFLKDIAILWAMLCENRRILTYFIVTYTITFF